MLLWFLELPAAPAPAALLPLSGEISEISAISATPNPAQTSQGWPNATSGEQTLTHPREDFWSQMSCSTGSCQCRPSFLCVSLPVATLSLCPEPGWHLEPSDLCHQLGQCRGDAQQRPAGFGRALGAPAEGSLADLRGALILRGLQRWGEPRGLHTHPSHGRKKLLCQVRVRFSQQGRQQLFKEEVFETVLCCK